MTGRLGGAWTGFWRRWRRARNLRAGRAGGRSLRWGALAAGLAVAAGAGLIAGHARQLVATGEAQLASVVISPIEVLQSAAPGAAFAVPPGVDASVTHHSGAAIVVVAGMRAATPVSIDLCTQLQADGRFSPLRVGFQFDAIARLAARSEAQGRLPNLRNVALASGQMQDMPQVTITGQASQDFAKALKLSYRSSNRKVQWASDAGDGAFVRDGWLVWGEGALRVQRRTSASCRRAGELLVQAWRKDHADPQRALVTAFPARGSSASAWLRPGSHVVPSTPRASLEDQALFQDLLAHGLVRLNRSGLAEVAPRDLMAWQAAGPDARSGELASWAEVGANVDARKLFKRLYRMADGAYVREQVRIFNSERRLLAWRVRPAQASTPWQASVAAAPVATGVGLPPAASRLLAEVPQGWGAWSQVTAWPENASGAAARLNMALPAPALGSERIEVMLVGRVQSVSGAALAGPARDACSGRACPAPSSIQVLTLAPAPGARSIALEVHPFDMSGLGGDQQYRHLRVAGGKLAWRALASNSSTERRAAPAAVLLEDRNGTVLWRGGAPTTAADAAGLSTMLGLRAEHANSVAGMLARVPSPGGEGHSARLTLDLEWQKLAQHALECIGMRRGHSDGVRCHGGQAAPPGRQAGMVVIDTANGDILVAAGAGTGHVDTANWDEVRDFDRANPDRSPLRLPALQHDGGAHRSPGSTFKVVSALGLELAAERNPQLESLLAGMPLASINRMAQATGFAFQTNAPSYPVGTRLAHITNYKDQHLDRRAQDGRLGLAQALTYSLNTWFAWSGELSDASLLGRAEGGMPDLRALDTGALDEVRPIAAMAHRLGFERALRLDAGLMPDEFRWSQWDALQASVARIDPIDTRHELRQMAIGLRMQATPLHMAMVAGAVGEGRVVKPRLLLELDGREAEAAPGPKLGVRLDRIRAGMKGVVEGGTAAAAFRSPQLASIRRGLAGKTGTSPAMLRGPDGVQRELATVWFTGWLEPGSFPGQERRLAVAAFVSHSEATGGEHAAPVVAAVLAKMTSLKREQKGKQALQARLAN